MALNVKSIKKWNLWIIRITPAFCGALLTYFLNSTFSDDSWDSATISIYEATKDISLIDRWFLDASMFEQYWQIKLFIQLSEIVNVSYYQFHKLFLVLIVFFLIFTISSLVFRVTESKKWGFFAGIFCMLFPTWPLSSSSVLDYYLIALSMGLFGAKLFICSSSKILKFSGVVLILYSTGYAVMYVMAIIYILLYARISTKDQLKRILKSNLFLGLLVLLLGKYFLTRTIFPTKNRYQDYNKFLDLSSLDSWISILIGIKAFSSFIIYVAVMILLPFLLHIFLTRNLSIEAESAIKKGLGEVYKVRIVLLAFFGSTLPFIFVGKSTSLFWIEFNTGRHAIPLLVSLTLLLSVVGQNVTMLFRKNQFHRPIMILTFLSVFMLSLVPSAKSWSDRVEESRIRLAIIKTLKPYGESISPGIVRIQIKGSKNYTANASDASLVMFRISGNFNAQTSIIAEQFEAKIDMSGILQESNSARDSNIKLASECTTYILLESNNDPGHLLKNLEYRVLQNKFICP